MRLIMKVCAVLLTGLLVWAIQGLATAQSVQPPADDPPLVRVIDHGGLCVGGRECSTETAILADGTVTRQSAGDVANWCR